ncbi:ribonuclease H-like domain-containing protein [Tanacetum coccineum]
MTSCSQAVNKSPTHYPCDSARTFRVILFSIHNDEWKSFQCHHQTALRNLASKANLIHHVLDRVPYTLSMGNPVKGDSFKSTLLQAQDQISQSMKEQAYNKIKTKTKTQELNDKAISISPRKLYSLDKHQFIFSRDVKFFENILPFKDSDKVKDVTEKVFQYVNHINFFDLEYPETPNDDERVDPKLIFNSGNDADSSDNNFATQDERVTTLEENVFSEEMNALLRNGTWDIVKLPKGRKDIGSIDYEETFSPVVKMVTVRCLLNIAMSQSWPIFQLDVNNAFLYGDLDEVVYMRPPEGYFPSGNRSDYSLFTKTDKSVFLALLVYVDDIITVVDTEKGICLNQRKYVLDLLSEYGMLACKRVDTPLLSKLVISNEAKRYISYVVHCLSQFMHSSLKSHLKTAFKILRYLKGCPGLGIHFVKTSGMFLSAFSDADWAKCVITRKSVTAEYRALASVTSEVIWILNFLKDLKIENLLPVYLHCDSNSAIKIAANPVFHERTKHLEINLHFVKEIFLKGVVKTVKVDSANQIANVFTKGLGTIQEKLGMYDIYQVEMKGTLLQKRA